MAKKNSSSLDGRIRDIKDSDEFVEHVRNIVRRYKREYGLGASEVQRELRQRLREFHKHAAAVLEFVQTAERGKKTSIERDALRLITQGSNVASADLSLAWLRETTQAAQATLDEMKGDQAVAHVRAMGAEALRATFEHHAIKFVPGSAKNPGAVAHLLAHVAKSAGDADLSVLEARELCIAAKKGSAVNTHVSKS